MMQIGMGVMGWPPSEFWQATPYELYAAVEGWQGANGGGGEDKYPDRESIEDLVVEYGDGT
jgi:uncharacterized phage protein (TIGR02216 family)